MENKGTALMEAFENLVEESTNRNVSPSFIMNEIRGEGSNSIEKTLKKFIGDVEKMYKKDTFYCNSCGADDWFDCDCSYSEYESNSEKKVIKSNETKSDKQTIEISPDSRDVADETKSGKEEVVVKPKARIYACNFDECQSLFYTKKRLKRHTNSVHLKLGPFKCTKCSSVFTRKQSLQYHMNSVHLKLKVR